ncbi:MAG: class I SAM-dependent methyltransferase [Magnetococcales bacterium]|nr:class I SAM-dependent methyltransferase [Magnetococcales bacterium]
MIIPSERKIYASSFLYFINLLLVPVKMLVPQPLIRIIPGLTSNEDLRLGLARQAVIGRLLDIGCGSNRLVREYRADGFSGEGVDVHPWPGVDRVVDDSGSLPYEDGDFDSVVLIACINHIPNRSAVLAEVYRLLTPDGRLILTFLTPLISRIWHAWAFWDSDQNERGMKEGEVWGFTLAELTDLLGAAGFTVIRRVSFTWGLNRLWICQKAFSADWQPVYQRAAILSERYRGLE